MPWGWAPRHEVRAQSHAEPSSTTPWKEHEAQVLKRLLESNEGRFNTGGFADNEARFVYLQEQARAGVRDEAEADLVHGFRAWLQGTHPENMPGRTDKYQNKADGRPHRRRMDGTRYPTEQTDWQSTPWGDAQLTHLPGVREWLRENAIATDKADLRMQILAEYGPHDLESAWQYYKHWVLKRPISYPHAHAKASDKENWHGPGTASDRGWAPRRSSHFDALPPPPSKPPDEYDLFGGELFAEWPATPAVAEREAAAAPEEANASSLSNLPATPSNLPATPSAREEANALRNLPATPSELARSEAEAANLARIQEQIARNQQAQAELQERIEAQPGFRHSQNIRLSQLPPLPPTPDTEPQRRSARVTAGVPPNWSSP